MCRRSGLLHGVRNDVMRLLCNVQLRHLFCGYGEAEHRWSSEALAPLAGLDTTGATNTAAGLADEVHRLAAAASRVGSALAGRRCPLGDGHLAAA